MTKKQTFIIAQDISTTGSLTLPSVNFEIDGQATLTEILEAFEIFLIASSYVLPDGARVGLLYEEQDEKARLEDLYGSVDCYSDRCLETDTSEHIKHPVVYSTTSSVDSGKKITAQNLKAATKKSKKIRKDKK